MNVNVHGGTDTLGLGVIQYHGSTPAEKCIEVRNEELRTFRINLHRHIVCVCTDGGRVAQWEGVCAEWLKLSYVPVWRQIVFSSVGVVVTKLRTRLNDETVNTLVFLKTYYSCRR